MFCVVLRTNNDTALTYCYITEADSVHWAMRTAYLNTFQVDQTFNHRRSAGSILDQSVRDLWWTKWHWGRFFSAYCRIPCLCHSINFRTHLHLHVALTTGTNGRTLETFQQAVLFRIWESTGYKSAYFHLNRKTTTYVMLK